jgi:hypothetical protein
MPLTIEASARRLRRVQDGESLASIYADPRYPQATNYGMAFECDRGDLARWATTLHDETPIADCYASDPRNWRDEWLLSIGFRPDDEQDYLFINCGHDALFDLQAMAAGPWRLADPEGFIEIPRPKTRGSVRSLLLGLRIVSREKTD